MILTRRPGEAIVIDEHITVRVLGVEGERVKIGVDAPREVRVVREELLEGVRRSNLDAVTPAEKRARVLASLREALCQTQTANEST